MKRPSQPKLTGKVEMQLGRHTFIRIRHSEVDDATHAKELRGATRQLRYAATEIDKLAAHYEAKEPAA